MDGLPTFKVLLLSRDSESGRFPKKVKKGGGGDNTDLGKKNCVILKLVQQHKVTTQEPENCCGGSSEPFLEGKVGKIEIGNLVLWLFSQNICTAVFITRVSEGGREGVQAGAILVTGTIPSFLNTTPVTGPNPE